MYTHNPQVDGDWVSRSYNWFNRFGFLIWPEQSKIYQNLSERIKGKRVLEAGCGIGTGTALLSRNNDVIGTDKSSRHISFASNAYPWCNFTDWDITEKKFGSFEVVIAVEVIEHIEDDQVAFDNLYDSASEVLYITTPNKNNKELGQEKPINELHVREYTTHEFLQLIGDRDCNTKILHWETFEELSDDTDVTPLVYEICKEKES